MVASPLAHAQTTLNATYTSTPWDNTSSLATGSGLTLNLGLGFEYLIVGGGGGGGGYIGGGGGAGGFLTNVGGVATPQAAGNYAVTVGLGGAGGTNSGAGSNGNPSSVFSISASGGGAGGTYNSSNGTSTSGFAGASGGGGSPSNGGGAGGGSTSGSGTGNAGGSGLNTGGTTGFRAGGGGGAGSAGASTSSTVTGTGGAGVTSSITGVTGTFAGGGGGGSTGSGNFGTGGSGIGGTGGSTATEGTNGAANTGSGGGGGGWAFPGSNTGGSGGSGIVVVRYQSDTRLASGGSSSGTTGVWQFERFTSSGTLALSYAAANLLATQSGTITGSGGLTYNSAGTLNLTAANTFSGATRVQAGTLNLGNVNALQNSTLDMNGSDAGSIGFGVAGTNTYMVGGLQGSRNLAIGGNSLSVGGNAASTTYSGGLSGSGSLTKAGTGTLTLSGSSSHSGGTTLSAGTIVAGNDAALGTGTLTFASAGVTLSATGSRTLANDIALAASGTIAIGGSPATLSGAISGAGRLTKTGTGTLTLSGASSYSGGTLIAGGVGLSSTVRLGSNSALGTGTVTISGSNAGSGSTLDLNGATISNTIVIPALGSGIADTGALQNTNTSTAAVVNGPVQLGGGNYVGGNGSITFNGLISGGTTAFYALFKQGAGTWTLANPANTFDGLYYQIGGVTEVTKLANQGEASSLGQASVSQNSVSFGFNGSGGGTLRYIGSAASTSDRQFLLSGDTAAASNVIEANGTTPAASLTLTGNLSANRAGSYSATLGGTNAGVNVYAGAIGNGSGSVALVKQGSATWALTGANSYTGATTVSSGTLKVGNSGTTGVLGGGGASVAAGATLAFDRSDSGLVVSDIISGSGTVMQLGSGTTSLTGANTYTSPTQITAGMLRIGNGSTAGTLGSGGVSISAGAALAFNRSDSVTVSNAITGAGSVVKQAAGTLTLSGTSTYSGGTRLTAGTLIVGSDQALGTGTLSFATAGATLQTSRNIPVPIAVDANGTLAIVGSGVDLTANFSGGATLTKTGTGTLTLSGPASTFTGNLVIAGGAGANSIVRAGNTAAFGTGTVTINGGNANSGSTFDLNGNSLDNSIVLAYQSSGVNDTGALQNTDTTRRATLNGGVSIGGGIYVGGPGSITFNGVISGGSNSVYSIYKDGAGTWTYANEANTFDGFYYQIGGVTEVAKLANQGQTSSLGAPSTAAQNRVSFGFNGAGGGTIRYIGSAASTSDREFVLSGGTAAASNVIEASGVGPAATLTLTGNLSANRAGTYAATLGGTNAGVNVFSGTIANGSASSVSLVKQGSTTWALAGANTYSGSTTIAAGTLQVGNGGTTGELGGVGSVANEGVLAVNRSNAFAFGRVITGGGAFHQLGSGTTTLSGANTYSGGTIVSGGRLVGTTASLQGTIINDAAVEFAQTVGGTYAGVMVGTGSLVKTGNGTLAITADNVLSGLTTISAGTLQVGMGGGTGSLGTGDIDNAAALVVNRTGSLTIPGAISGTGGLTKQGAGNLVLSGSSSYTGATSVAAGRLSVNGWLGNSAVAVLAAAEIGGSGSIVGPVSIGSGGTLSPGNSIASLATGTATFASGATFEYEVDSTDVNSLLEAADLLVVSGDLNLDPGNGTLLTFFDLASSPNPFVKDTTIFALINYSGAWNGGLFTYNGSVLPDGGQFKVGSQQWEIDYDRTSPAGLANFTGDYVGSNFVAITAVPEPSTLALISIGLAGLLLARRRK